MPHHTLSAAVLFCGLALAGCDRRQQAPVSPDMPSNPPVAPQPPAGYWDATVTVLSVTGNQGACRYGAPVGATRTGVGWTIAVNADSISLDEDVSNAPTDDLPYSGRLNGLQFSAANTPGTSGPQVTCPLRGATLSGSFNGDFSRFDAMEILVWGTPGAEMTVRNQWVGVRQ